MLDGPILIAAGTATAAAAKSLQSCLTLCNPIDGSPPGSSIHGIFQARVLEWGVIAFSEYSQSFIKAYSVHQGSLLVLYISWILTNS